MNTKPVTLRDISTNIEAVVLADTGHAVEVTMATSKIRGSFLSVCGTIEALDAARSIFDRVAGLTFTDRDIDDEEPLVVVDFYATA